MIYNAADILALNLLHAGFTIRPNAAGTIDVKIVGGNMIFDGK